MASIEDVAHELGMKPAEVVAVADTDEGVVVDLFDGSTVVLVDGQPFLKGGNPDVSRIPVLPEPVEDEAPADEGDEAPAEPVKRAAKKAAAKAPADEGDDA